MDAKEIFQKMKAVFNELTNPADIPAPIAGADAAPVAATEYDLKIGGKVTIDKIETGGIVSIDGSPALPGELELADGTVITVGDNGVIAEVKQPAAAPEPPAPEDMSAKFTEFETKSSEKFAAMDAKFAAFETQFEKVNADVKKTMEVMAEMLKLSQILVEAPAAAPDATVKTVGSFKEDETGKVKVNPLLFS